VQSVPKWTFGAGLLVWWRELCIHCLGARHRSDWSCDAVRPSCSAVMGLAVPARASCRVYRSECGEPARDLACGAAQYGRYAAATYGGRDDANGSRPVNVCVNAPTGLPMLPWIAGGLQAAGGPGPCRWRTPPCWRANSTEAV
jgi:hypothetical protein